MRTLWRYLNEEWLIENDPLANIAVLIALACGLVLALIVAGVVVASIAAAL